MTQSIELAGKNDLRLHICHLSSAKSLELAKNASKTMPVSWEFTPHHLLLDNTTYNTYGTFIKTNPPLRAENESVRISDLDETSIIGTDHAPHTIEDKTKDTWSSSPGIPNLETVVSLLLTQVNKGNIDLSIIPKILSQNAAKVYGLENKGEIAIGKDADFTVIDLKQEGKFNKDEFEIITAVLDEIPEDASVTASTFFVPRLSQRRVIYEQYYHNAVDTEYLVLDLRSSNSVRIAEIEQPYIDAGYEMVVNYDGLIRVYCRGSLAY